MWRILATIPGLLRSLTSLRTWLLGRKWGWWLVFYLSTWVGTLIQKCIYFLGISFVAFTFATPVIVDMVAGPMLGMPDHWQAFLSMTRIDDALTVMVSAIVYRMSTSFKVERNSSSPFWGDMGTTP